MSFLVFHRRPARCMTLCQSIEIGDIILMPTEKTLLPARIHYLLYLREVPPNPVLSCLVLE